MGVLLSSLENSLAQLLAEQGDTVVYVNATTLSGPTPAPNPFTAVGGVTVATAALTGASAITLGAEVLTGRVVAGDKFQVAGDPTTYTISGQVIASGQQLAAAPFTPVLAQNEAQGAAVTFTFAAYSPSFLALVTSFPQLLINGQTVTVKDKRVRFLNSSLPSGVLPQIGGTLLLQGATTPAEIIRVAPAQVEGAIYAWFLQVRT